MLDFLLRALARLLLWLRYRIRVRGLEEVARRGTQGIAFLPNHPALIDPIILMTVLHRRFRPRALADQDQVDRPVIRALARRVGAVTLPSVAKYGQGVRAEVERALGEAFDGLNSGGNLLFYPSGHAQRSWQEDLRGNSGVEAILRKAPHVRVVLVRITGLWGSGFSWASGRPPAVAATLKKGLAGLLLSGILLAPRRQVTIEFTEPPDFPRTAGREELNAWLERFYNAAAQHNTYVPYSIWQHGGQRELPEPEAPRVAGALRDVPPATRETVVKHLADLAGRSDMRETDHLARDLGLDSLARTDLLAWVGEEFGFPQGDADALVTVGDVLLAASGHAPSSEFMGLSPVAARWFAEVRGAPRLGPCAAATIAQAFLRQARQHPRRIAIADQLRGARSYRDIVLGVMLLRPRIEELAGERLGIMLPASVAADVTYLATIFSGKTPVMVNWTLGTRNIVHSLDLTGVRHVLTSRALVSRIEAQGTDLSAIRERLIFLEDVAKRISLWAKLAALARSRLTWASLDKAAVSDTAAILFTSGSEALPKAVPLSHTNVLQNLSSVFQVFAITENDRLLGFLPPFHAFGITVTMLAPLCFGLRTVYHANPTDGPVLARLVEAYRATLVISTPTFLSGILRGARAGQLASLRLAITGAEQCPQHVYDTFEKLCPTAKLVQGYGVTECSPIVSVDDPQCPRRGTIGRVLPCFDRLLADPDTGEIRDAPATGVLLVSGPCIFSGYLNPDVPQPFVQHGGRSWYRTGDVVREDADGVLTFEGRRRRFVKRGGEMISLPAIEAVLRERHVTDADEGPVLAVEATPDETAPEIVLFTTRHLDRQAVNERLRDGGLSPLHNIRRVVRLQEIPLLGTGKIDYRALKALLRDRAV